MLTTLYRWRSLGSKELASGTKLIGHVPFAGPQAYLHEVYGSIFRALPTSEAIARIEEEAELKVPSELVDLYDFANGFSLYLGSFDVYGVRSSYSRDLDDELRQPVSLAYPNVLERPAYAPRDAFFFASYDWNGSQAYIASDHSVVLCEQFDASVILFKWRNLETMIGVNGGAKSVQKAE